MQIDPVDEVTLQLLGAPHILYVQDAWLIRDAQPAAGGVQWRRSRPGGTWRINLDGPDEETYTTLMRLHRELNDAGDVTITLADGRTLTGEAEAVSVAPGAAVLIGRTELVET